MGSAEKPAICQEDNLRACNLALQGIEVSLRDFRRLRARAGSFVYFDPPYHPLEGGSFTDYAKSGFGQAEQIALRDLCRELHQNDVKFMLSNSDTEFVHELYVDSSIFRQKTVQAPRMVNCKSDRRGSVNELLIANYDLDTLIVD